MFKAEIIADSKNEFGNRITTFVVTFPRIILAEFNTHRMLSRNSASSRAIPFEKMLKSVQENPFIPLKWMKDHKGMQGTEFFNDVENGSIYTAAYLENRWLDARDEAVKQAKALSEAGLTKQICNRLLEPFMYHTVIVTSTEWENFFALRAHEAAEIHMQHLAHLMLDEYNKSTPKLLKAGEWHIPFGDKILETELDRLADLHTGGSGFPLHESYINYLQKLKVQIATARCARVSYTVVGEDAKVDNYENDIKLHDRLSDSGHWSPFEHCARCMNSIEYDQYINGNTQADIEDNDGHGNLTIKVNLDETNSNGWSGNFRGFIQYRKTFASENKKDNRVIKK